ncbi:hypothetical protein BBK82_00155 [Lentzea guizhouensis]|uniref:Uncharacterized protein n=1 Tax=Lentzea guizhouensis TaxID=1586287 RepID=A0A1B2HAI3_9PSEU|nr:hypothetical protein [Lentzea guizhouensis]ANZ34724.1 hypothetical protein BBK82_00155 [Lentzea guizhouensis]
MFDEPWPETVAGWEFTRSDSLERYRRQLTNGVTVGARWDVERQRGQVRAYVQPAGSGRTLTSSREEFRTEEAMWTAARMVLDMAANLPSFRTGDESPAQPVLFGDVAGDVEVKPGCGGEPDAELTFTLTDGRSVTVVLTEEQADAMESGIYSVRKHVWSEYDTDNDSTEEDEDEDEQEEPVPDVTGVDSGPDTGHELITVLEKRFGVTEDLLVAHVDWSAVIVVGEPAVSTLVERADELREAIAPRWWPGLLERPGENWVVLSRA